MSDAAQEARPRRSVKGFAVVALLVSVLLAGGLSYYASTHPDGLERVAEQTGFAGSGRDSAVSDSPLADYQVRGVEDERLSGGLAGVAGAVVVLVLATGVAYAVRRRGVPDED